MFLYWSTSLVKKCSRLNCSSFVYLQLGNFIFTEHNEMYWVIDHFFKNKCCKYRGIKSLSQHFEKEIYRYVNITWLFLTEKHVCWSPFLILNIAKFLRAPILKNIWEWMLLKMCSWNWETLKFIVKSLSFTLKNRFFQHQYHKQVHDWYFIICFSWSLYWHKIFI